MRRYFVLLLVIALFVNPFPASGMGLVMAQDSPDVPEGNDFAITWKPFVPTNTNTVIRFDNASIKDDLAFLAAIPRSVFTAEDRTFAGSMIFWEPQREGLTQAQLMQNHKQGVDYYLEDWEFITADEEVPTTLIGFDTEDRETYLSEHPADDITSFGVGNPYRTAADIALSGWGFSDTAIIVPVEESYPDVDREIKGELAGTIPSAKPEVIIFEGTKSPSPVDPNFHAFNVKEDYKFIISDMEWFGPFGQDDVNDLTVRGRDPDLQLYDMSLGQVAASEEWNPLSGAFEHLHSYLYNPGEWKSSVTYMPTEEYTMPAIAEDGVGRRFVEDSIAEQIDIFRERVKEGLYPVEPQGPDVIVPKDAFYTITNVLYPGTDIPIPEPAGFYSSQGWFNLTWEGAGNLGLLVRGPSGAEIAADIGTANPKTVNVVDMGSGPYTLSVVALDDTASGADFDLTYRWEEPKKLREGENLASASNGAVLASITNSPLLYMKNGAFPEETLDAMNRLGVTEVIMVDLGGHSDPELVSSSRLPGEPELDITYLDSPEEMYGAIYDRTEQNDIVFTTINPWTYWDIGKGPAGEEEGALYLGPAAYLAAAHGGPVIVTDVHEETAAAQAWHNQYWRTAYLGRYPPSVGCMVLTGRVVYDFLGRMGLDPEGPEQMITVAGQFDIGTSWDRTYVGPAHTGRIMGSPVDAAYWNARNVLYTQLIWANPGVWDEGVQMVSGSYSTVPDGRVIDTPEVTQRFKYPLVQTWTSYQHRFNERGGIWWGAEYTTASGITPFRTASSDPMDAGGVYPDLTVTEDVPHYAEFSGYSNVFVTNHEKTMDNINSGTVLWMEVMHGGSGGSGVVGVWGDNRENNPWRGYENGGSTFEPDTVAMSFNTGIDYIPNPLPTTRGHDGVIIAIAQQLRTGHASGYDFDNDFENLHSMGFNGGSCLIANTYMHLSMVRHGMSYQVIDPWLTSWYSAFAMEMFMRDIAKGTTVGEAYSNGIGHVGILYLEDQWWWDIFENVIYYGDPGLRMWSPEYSWEEPAVVDSSVSIEGHAVNVAGEHPNSIFETGWILGLFLLVIVIAVVMVILKKKQPDQYAMLLSYIPKRVLEEAVDAVVEEDEVEKPKKPRARKVKKATT